MLQIPSSHPPTQAWRQRWKSVILVNSPVIPNSPYKNHCILAWIMATFLTTDFALLSFFKLRYDWQWNPVFNLFFKCFLLKKIFMFIFGRDRDSVWAREGQRERKTQNPKQAPGSKLSAQNLMWAQNHKPRDHDLSHNWMLNWLSHPDAPMTILMSGAWEMKVGVSRFGH